MAKFKVGDSVAFKHAMKIVTINDDGTYRCEWHDDNNNPQSLDFQEDNLETIPDKPDSPQLANGFIRERNR